MSTFARRLLGAARLEVSTYEEIEADRRGTAQAMLVVVLSSVAGGLGTAGIAGYSPRSLVLGTLAALVAWFAWATLIYIMGTRLLPESQTRADVGELLRTIGFASAPGLLRVVGIVPGLAWPTYLLTSIWMLAAMVVAVRQALDFTSSGRALAVCAAGWLLALVIAVVMGVVLGPTVQ
jgi:hypothetical protein